MDRPEIDFLSGAFYVEGARNAYRWLRDNAPVYFDDNSGLWGVSTYEAVMTVGRDAATFSNAGGSRPDTGPLPWMIDLDGDDHTKRRGLVSRGFTPGRVRSTEPNLRAICDALIDGVIDRGECDFVADIAVPLPLMVIADMVGIPVADRDKLLGWTHDLLASLTGEPEGYATAADAFGAWLQYAQAMTNARRATPTDDLWSVLVHAAADGEALSDDEIAMEALLLFIGGDETTRQVAAGGMEQLLLGGLLGEARADLPAAVEEMLRWVSPIKNMARTTSRPVELAGTELPVGVKLIVLYESANFDERHFARPDVFDLRRTPNDHLAFGFGRHFCLGASLARAELAVLFDRVLSRMSRIALAIEGPAPRSITGIDSLPILFSP
ncbi:MAG TPA: cytochrome P450 [Acidimicrobiales bacterium]|nr:cytochrome P450 [Acidimicrobiales bacterium]